MLKVVSAILGIQVFIVMYSPVTLAQRSSLKCTVVDSITKEPLLYVSYRLKDQQTMLLTDGKGRFELVLNKQMFHDTLIFSHKDYVELRVPVLKLKSNNVIMLAPKGRILKAVTVKNKTAKEDSLALRQEFAKDFTFTKPKVIEAFSLTSINFDILYASLSKKNKQRKKLRAILERDEIDNYIDSRFNRRTVLKVARLDSARLREFMAKHRPAYGHLKKLTDYELLEYIKLAVKNDSLHSESN